MLDTHLFRHAIWANALFCTSMTACYKPSYLANSRLMAHASKVESRLIAYIGWAGKRGKASLRLDNGLLMATSKRLLKYEKSRACGYFLSLSLDE